MPSSILLTGATGYVGGELLPRLLSDGHAIRALARSPDRADLPGEVEKVRGDVVEGEGLEAALDGIDTAYYLVHSMGRGSGPVEEFAQRDRRAATNFGRAAAAKGVGRIVYLGGLDDVSGGTASAHLRSREEVARVLAEHVPGTVHARAAMVIGEGSASFKMLNHLVRRLPAMITPRWVDTRSQPIAIDDVTAALAALATHDDPPGEVQLGGRDVLTYREMMDRFAKVIGRRPPVAIPFPYLTPGLSSLWVTLVTGVERGLVRPLVDGLSAEMIVTRRPPPGVNDEPLGFDEAVRRATAAA